MVHQCKCVDMICHWYCDQVSVCVDRVIYLSLMINKIASGDGI